MGARVVLVVHLESDLLAPNTLQNFNHQNPKHHHSCIVFTNLNHVQSSSSVIISTLSSIIIIIKTAPPANPDQINLTPLTRLLFLRQPLLQCITTVPHNPYCYTASQCILIHCIIVHHSALQLQCIIVHHSALKCSAYKVQCRR